MAGLMVCSSLAGCIFEDGSDDGNQEVLAVFSFNPSKNIKVGDSVSFDASSSTPNDGSLTYRWNFDTEGSIDIDATGLTATWTFDEAKTYKVTLEVSDGSTTSEQIRDLVVAPESAEAPTAEITQYADDEDCEDEEITETRHILVWICARDKSTTDRAITETTTVQLDASSSDSGDSTSQYIPDDGYAWDLDLTEDKDNDGDPENDDFEIRGLLGQIGAVLIVYNRNGRKVFESEIELPTENTLIWSGRYDNGEPAPEGVYQWVLVRPDGEKEVGNISLFR